MMADGQVDALEAIYDRYSSVAYGLALRIVGDRGAAEEIVQDAFVKLWQQAGRYDVRQGRLYSWLLRIVRNRAIDELRRLRVPGRASAVTTRQDQKDLDRPARDSSVNEGDEALWISELRLVVGEALLDLPGEQRRVIELAYYEGYSQREIAERTGISLGTVKTRTRLALGKLRKVLNPGLKEHADADGL